MRSKVWLKKGKWSEPANFESHGPVFTPEGDDDANPKRKGVKGGYYPVRKLLCPVSSAQLKEWQASRASQSIQCATPFEALAQYDAIRYSFETGQQKHGPLCCPL